MSSPNGIPSSERHDKPMPSSGTPLHERRPGSPADLSSMGAGSPQYRSSAQDGDLPASSRTVRQSVGGESERVHEPHGGSSFASLERFVRDHPVLVLAGTAAVGAAVAVALSRRSPRGQERSWSRDLSRYSDDVQRAVRSEIRSVMNDDRVNRLVNAIPTADVSKAVAPWLAQLVEAFTSAKDQAKRTVADSAQTVHDKLS
jgi:hypothetical protein